LYESVQLVEFDSLTEEQRSQLEGDEPDPFDARGITLQFRAKDRHVGLRDGMGRLVASAGLVLAEVEVERERLDIVGLGGVIVNADHRGRGLGREVVQAALGSARGVGPAFAILFCHADRGVLYRKLGFAEVNAEVLVQQPAGYVPIPQRTMWRALHDGARWPAGRVVVESLPF
jgi:predicted N-acetyltransferase YhbS